MCFAHGSSCWLRRDARPSIARLLDTMPADRQPLAWPVFPQRLGRINKTHIVEHIIEQSLYPCPHGRSAARRLGSAIGKRGGKKLTHQLYPASPTASIRSERPGLSPAQRTTFLPMRSGSLRRRCSTIWRSTQITISMLSETICGNGSSGGRLQLAGPF